MVHEVKMPSSYYDISTQLFEQTARENTCTCEYWRNPPSPYSDRSIQLSKTQERTTFTLRTIVANRLLQRRSMLIRLACDTIKLEPLTSKRQHDRHHPLSSDGIIEHTWDGAWSANDRHTYIANAYSSTITTSQNITRISQPDFLLVDHQPPPTIQT